MRTPVAPLTQAERFFSKVARPDNDDRAACWEWTAFVMKNGYGKFGMGRGKSPVLAHRWSCEFFKGEIPAGLVIDHLCRNRRCVNPDHLEAVTTRTNLLRGDTFTRRFSEQTHCANGHEYTPGNTEYPNVNNRDWRRCITCARTRARQWYDRNRRGANGKSVKSAANGSGGREAAA